MRVEEVSLDERVEMRWVWSVGVVSFPGRKKGVRCTLFIHTLLDGIFVVGFGGVLKCAAEAGRCHFWGKMFWFKIGFVYEMRPVLCESQNERWRFGQAATLCR